MKVLKKEDTSTWSHRWTCGRCKSELEAEGGDIQHKTVKKYGNDQRDPGDYSNEDSFYVVCAVCVQQHDLDTGKIPYLLRDQAKKRKVSSSYGYFGDK